jgi:hypothetical protein
VRTWFAIAAIVASVGLTYGRIFYGVDFTDEAFYVAVPYRLVLGAQPLVDETNVVQQTPALLLYPFVALWHAIFEADGIVLYARHLHFLFTLGIGAAVYVSLRRLIRNAPSSALLAATAVAFVPFGIHALSYNTFATGFFTAGCFLGAAWTVDGRRAFLVAAGCAHGLAVFTYPTFGLAVACWFAIVYATDRPRSLRDLAPGLLAAVAGTAAALAFFLHRGIGTIQDLVRQTSEFGDQGGDAGKLVEIGSFVWTSFAHKEVAAVLLLAAAVLLHRRSPLALVPLALLPVAALPGDLRTSASANEYVTAFALLAPFVFLSIRDSRPAQRMLALVWVPAAVAGTATAMSSANGAISVAIGFFPATIVTAALIWLALERVGRTGAAPAAVLVSLAVALQYLSVYRDDGVRRLTSFVAEGPYAGIYTTASKRDFLLRLEKDLAAASGPACRVVFYDTFPAGYLLGHGRPATNATWLLDVADEHEAAYQRLLLDYYSDGRGLPDLAVRMDGIPMTESVPIVQTYDEHEPLERALAGYETLSNSSEYRIKQARRTSCADR